MTPRDPTPYRRALEGLLGVPATEGNELSVLRNGVEIFPAMLEAIRSAEHTVDLLTFIYWTGRIAEEMAGALSDRAQDGLRVRVLLDAIGARSMDQELLGAMREAGVDVEFFRPPTNLKVWEHDNRTHRKILICDEQVGFTGGVGIAEEWEGDARRPEEWRDTHLRVRGPAVNGLRAAFLENWVETGRQLFDPRDRFPEMPQDGDSTVQVLRSDPTPGWTNMRLLFRTLLGIAEERLRISTAYFVPDDDMIRLLCDAARDGLHIEILLPGPHADKRVVQLAQEDCYSELLDADITVRAYQPTMLHTKILLVDDTVASVGSANFNSRSMAHDDEVMLITFDPDVIETLNSHFDEDVERSDAIDPADWEKRGVIQRLKEAAVDLVDGEI